MEPSTCLSTCTPYITQCVGTRVTEGSPLLWGFAAGRLGLEIGDLFCIGLDVGLTSSPKTDIQHHTAYSADVLFALFRGSGWKVQG